MLKKHLTPARGNLVPAIVVSPDEIPELPPISSESSSKSSDISSPFVVSSSDEPELSLTFSSTHSFIAVI